MIWIYNGLWQTNAGGGRPKLVQARGLLLKVLLAGVPRIPEDYDVCLSLKSFYSSEKHWTL